MGGYPNYSIRALWNMANYCIDHHCTSEEYWHQSNRDTQAIRTVQKARNRKNKQENSNG